VIAHFHKTLSADWPVAC